MRKKIKPLHNKTCLYCGGSYQSVRSDSKVCSSTCRTYLAQNNKAIKEVIPIVREQITPIIRDQVYKKIKEEEEYYTCDLCFYGKPKSEVKQFQSKSIVKKLSSIPNINANDGIIICDNCLKGIRQRNLIDEYLYAERIAEIRVETVKRLLNGK